MALVRSSRQGFLKFVGSVRYIFQAGKENSTPTNNHKPKQNNNCPNGANGANGPNGPNGPNGAIGANGANGEPKDAAEAKENKVFELRSYYINPKDVKMFGELVDKHLQLRTAHSELLGYWMAELGALNRAIHIWPYESCEQRQDVRKALAADQCWNSLFLTKMLPLVCRQESELLTLLPGMSLVQPPNSGVYELQRFTLNVPVQSKEKELTEFCQKFAEIYNCNKSVLIGGFNTMFGSDNAVYFLLQHPSFDKGLSTKADFLCEASDLNIWKEVRGLSSIAMCPKESISPLK